jgi:alpha-tubulin suppressor-like RCC1 family protein
MRFLPYLPLAENDEVWAWGWNGFGELGMGDVDVRLQPYCLNAFKRTRVTGVSE